MESILTHVYVYIVFTRFVANVLYVGYVIMDEIMDEIMDGFFKLHITS